MEYIKADIKNLTQVYEIVQKTIKAIYPNYYSREVVDFFCQLHNKDNILKDIMTQSIGILADNKTIVGTGSLIDNHITRVYVLPVHQKKGYGTYIMEYLEREAAHKYTEVYLDASLPAVHLYENRGYQTVEHRKWNVKNGKVLVYEVMKKNI